MVKFILLKNDEYKMTAHRLSEISLEFEKYLNENIKKEKAVKVELMLFDGARHEPHNKTNKDEVFEKWINWIIKN